MSSADEGNILKTKKLTDKTPLPPKSSKRSRRRKRRDDSAWWLGGFLFGVMVGLGMSLYYGWVLSPRPLPTTPAELRAVDKAFYIRLIASAFAYDGDVGRAEARLATLGNLNLTTSLIAVAESDIRQNGDVRDIGALVGLAETVGEVSVLMSAYQTTPTATPTQTSTPKPTRTPSPTVTPSHTATVLPLTNTTISTLTMALKTVTGTKTVSSTVTSRPTRIPTATATRRPTRTPTPNPNAPFRVVQSRFVCDRRVNRLLKIYVRDRLGVGIPGVEIVVKWANGQDNFFTGFKPNVGPGYADFEMELNKIYQVNLVNLEVQPPLPSITIENNTTCSAATPSWQLVFQKK